MHGEWIMHSVSLLYFLLKCIQKSHAICLSVYRMLLKIYCTILGLTFQLFRKQAAI